MRSQRKTEFVPARRHAVLTTGEVIRMLRELKGWTQAELAERSGISTTNISLLENAKVEIGKEARRTNSKGLRCSSCHYYVSGV